MKDCYIVVHRNYADGENTYAFWSGEDARKNVDEDIKTVEAELTKNGYEAKTLLHTFGDDLLGAEVYVPDSDIYYEWNIVFSNIQ